MPDDGDPVGRLRRLIEETRNDLTELKKSISGSPYTGPGLLARIATLEVKVRDVADAQEDASREDAQRRDAEKEQRKKRDRIVIALLVALLSLVTGLILELVSAATGVPTP
ncbi:MAG: hypothetical protein ACRDQA_12480 [Nocardioidaceae bacterium]